CAGYRQINRQGVDRLVVDPELVMQVRPCGPAGRTDVADVVALANLHALLDSFGEAFLVSVKSGDVVLVRNDDGVAVAPLPAGELHNAICGGANGSAAGGCVVDALVRAPAAMNRMAPATECGADACELQGVAQEGP